MLQIEIYGHNINEKKLYNEMSKQSYYIEKKR